MLVSVPPSETPSSRLTVTLLLLILVFASPRTPYCAAVPWLTAPVERTTRPSNSSNMGCLRRGIARVSRRLMRGLSPARWK
jgi:hypothetical protein